MCGILGIVDLHGQLDLKRAKLAQQSIRHRGPDYQGHYTDSQGVFLGHNRLSIIDLSNEANQPFFSSHEQVAIILNGEIYNYRELRNELPAKRCRTQSDTEVVLEGFLIYEADFFKRLRGIYAFAIFDFRGPLKLTIARDPSGVKPLYYFLNNDQLILASEIKAILLC